MVPEIPSGFSQRSGGSFKPHITGDYVISSGSAPLTPPDLPFTLTVESLFEQYSADLFWTSTNKTASAGFGYEVEYRVDGGSWISVAMVTGNSYSFTAPATPGFYEFKITSYNDAGEGAVSNEAGVNLPGELSDQSRLIEDGSGRLLEDGTLLLLG